MKCQALADNAQKDLEEALPALEEAMRVSKQEGSGKGVGWSSLSSKSLGLWEEEEGDSAQSYLHKGSVLLPK